MVVERTGERMISEEFLKDNYEKLGEERLWEVIQKNIEERQKQLISELQSISNLNVAIIGGVILLITLFWAIYQIGQQQLILAIVLAGLIIGLFIQLGRVSKIITNQVPRIQSEHNKECEKWIRLFLELKEKRDNKRKSQ
jgi:hypothetical protein